MISAKGISLGGVHYGRREQHLRRATNNTTTAASNGTQNQTVFKQKNPLLGGGLNSTRSERRTNSNHVVNKKKPESETERIQNNIVVSPRQLAQPYTSFANFKSMEARKKQNLR